MIGHCVYGVDINPMAVELCKVALWMEALEPGKPLSFLKHHIQCGNSLLGTTPALLAQGIPDAAFEPIEGDDKALCRAFKKQNKEERRGQGDLFARLCIPGNGWATWPRPSPHSTRCPTIRPIRCRPRSGGTRSSLRKRATGHRAISSPTCGVRPSCGRRRERSIIPITERIFRRVETSPHDVTPWMYDEVRRLAGQYQFLHWHQAFPGVFRPPAKGEKPDNELTGWCGGFDVVLGNPPWERIKLQEQEWFAAHGRADIAQARTAAARGKMIRELETGDPSLYQTFLDDRRKAEGESHLVRDSSGEDAETGRSWGMYPLCGRGDVNTYSLFAELNRNLINSRGRVGCILPIRHRHRRHEQAFLSGTC